MAINCGEDRIPMGFTQSETWDFAQLCYKRKFRWKFSIPSICDSEIGCLPPSKVSRPNLSFKDIECQHINEIIYFPGKPEWKPLQLTLYDIAGADQNPVFAWIQRLYNITQCSNYKPALEAPCFKVAAATLSQFSGCGELQETWIFEHIYAQNIEFSDLDYGDSGIVMVDLTLRYDRAYISYPTLAPTLDFNCDIDPDLCPELNTPSIISVDECPQPTFSVTPLQGNFPILEFQEVPMIDIYPEERPKVIYRQRLR